MDSVDRATLIDFTLGRLDDAEAAKLVRRAERDSEFAQTLADLRRELATLDDVRPLALRSRFPRLPLVDAETSSPSETTAPSDDENRVVYFDERPANAVKVRRVGPVYPYYADEDDLSDDASSSLQTALSPLSLEEVENAQTQQNGEKSQEAQEEQNAEDGQEAQIKQNAEDGQEAQEEQNAEDGQEAQEEQNAEDGQGAQEEQNSEDGQGAQEEQNSEDGQGAQIKQNGEDGESLDDESARFPSSPKRPRRLNFIPKFIAAPRDSRRSTFVAKRARFLGDADASLNERARAAASSPLDELENVALPEKNANDDAPISRLVANSDAPISENDAASSASFVETAVEISPSDEERFDATRPLDEPELEEMQTVADDAPQEADVRFENAERSDFGAETRLDDGDFNVARNDRFDADALAVSERRLAELLGRAPTQDEKEEYYWEPIDETPNVETPSKKRSALGATTRFATETTIAIGRTTLTLCGFERRAALGSDAFAATQARRRRRRRPGQVSDMMISTVFGFLIAVVVVWPLICLAAKDVFLTITQSAVRKIGVSVPISANAPQQDVLPFITERVVFPRYNESTALRQDLPLVAQPLDSPVPQPLDDATTQETGARFETPAFADPASTPPTLAPESADVGDAPLGESASPLRVPQG